MGLLAMDDARDLVSAPRQEVLPPHCAAHGHCAGGCRGRRRNGSGGAPTVVNGGVSEAEVVRFVLCVAVFIY